MYLSDVATQLKEDKSDIVRHVSKLLASGTQNRKNIQNIKNMKYFIIITIFFCHSSFSQNNLSYAKSQVPYVAPPTKQILQLMNNREKLYYSNRDYCNQIEDVLIEDFKSLRIESINIKYREGLKRNLNLIQSLKEEGNYSDYYLILEDIVDDIKNNNLYYEDEDEYNNNILKEKIKKQEQETLELKRELEYQKSLNKKLQLEKKK